MIVTNHAARRARERLGLSRKAFERLASKAFELGYTFKHFKKGRMTSYYRKLFQASNKKCAGIRIYGLFVYMFTRNGMLKTVFPLPSSVLNYKVYVKKEISFEENTFEKKGEVKGGKRKKYRERKEDD